MASDEPVPVMIKTSFQERRWQKGLAHTKKFIEREGHVRLQDSYEEDGFKLVYWISRQRRDYKSGILAEERRRALEALDGWVWDPMEAAWQRGLAHARQFVEREGHARVPLWHIEVGVKLGTWVSRQRQAYKRGELPRHRREALEALEGWTWNTLDEAWREGLDHVKRFAEREGHARVPVKHVEDGFRLGQWVNSQRADYKRDELSLERQEALEALDGWVWAQWDATWQSGLDYAKRFVARESHARVPNMHVEDEFKLGTWIGRQRQACKAGKLSAERKEALQALEGWVWDPLEDGWNEGLEYAKRFVAREGHACVPAAHVEDGFELGSWVRWQRRWRERNKLTVERRRALEALEGWTWNAQGRPGGNVPTQP